MEIRNWLNGTRAAVGGDSEVRLCGDMAYKKWRIPVAQVKLYQAITNSLAAHSFMCDGYRVRILPIEEVTKVGRTVLSASTRVDGRTINQIDQPEKGRLGRYFQSILNNELEALSGADGINVITWNAMLMDDNETVWITDIASDVSAVSLQDDSVLEDYRYSRSAELGRV